MGYKLEDALTMVTPGQVEAAADYLKTAHAQLWQRIIDAECTPWNIPSDDHPSYEVNRELFQVLNSMKMVSEVPLENRSKIQHALTRYLKMLARDHASDQQILNLSKGQSFIQSSAGTRLISRLKRSEPEMMRQLAYFQTKMPNAALDPRYFGFSNKMAKAVIGLMDSRRMNGEEITAVISQVIRFGLSLENSIGPRHT